MHRVGLRLITKHTNLVVYCVGVLDGFYFGSIDVVLHVVACCSERCCNVQENTVHVVVHCLAIESVE